jgi:hypothetical protein
MAQQARCSLRKTCSVLKFTKIGLPGFSVCRMGRSTTRNVTSRLVDGSSAVTKPVFRSIVVTLQQGSEALVGTARIKARTTCVRKLLLVPFLAIYSPSVD